MNRSIGRFSQGRDNNLNLLRFSAASLVVLTHAYGDTGNAQLEPLKALFGISMGSWAVDIFFAISGFLVCKSWDRSRSPTDFLLARGLRIYPGLWACVVFCVLVVGAAGTTLALHDFFAHRDTWRFVAANSTLLIKGVNSTLPGVFDGNSVNSPLWTLPYELKMYLVLLLLGWSGLLYRRGLVLAMVIVSLAIFSFGAWSGAHEATLPEYARFVFCFFSGSWLYLARDRVEFKPVFALGLGLLLVSALALQRLDLRIVALTFATPYLALYAAFVPSGAIRRFNRLGDYSYGIYIYGSPSLVLALRYGNDPHSVWQTFALGMSMALALACASWHLLESRALRMRPRVSRSRVDASTLTSVAGREPASARNFGR